MRLQRWAARGGFDADSYSDAINSYVEQARLGVFATILQKM